MDKLLFFGGIMKYKATEYLVYKYSNINGFKRINAVNLKIPLKIDTKIIRNFGIVNDSRIAMKNKFKTPEVFILRSYNNYSFYVQIGCALKNKLIVMKFHKVDDEI
jgi:hypothetical protein